MAASDRICLLRENRAYCGRRGLGATPHRARVTCPDCKAALAADEQASGGTK